MNSAAVEIDTDIDTTTEHQQVLQLARSLDAIGRRTEEFLCEQLGQLERAIDEFEAEKAAWRRQHRRESQELARQREEIDRLMKSQGRFASMRKFFRDYRADEESHGRNRRQIQRRGSAAIADSDGASHRDAGESVDV
jgi:hypothetical protein